MAHEADAQTPLWRPGVVAAAWDVLAAWDELSLSFSLLHAKARFAESVSPCINAMRRRLIKENAAALERWRAASVAAGPLLQLPGTRPMRSRELVMHCERVVAVDVSGSAPGRRTAGATSKPVDETSRDSPGGAVTQQRRGTGTG